MKSSFLAWIGTFMCEESRYEMKVVYIRSPDPPLSAEEAKWAGSRLEKQLGS